MLGDESKEQRDIKGDAMTLKSQTLKAKAGDNQSGAVALLTAIIVSILLTIVVTSMVGLTVGEQRQSTDADQSIRAYYASEAGVEDGLKEVKAYLGGGPTPPAGCVSASVGPSVDYTCKQISLTTNHLTGSRNVEESEQLEPGVSSNYNEMVIRWHQYGTDPDVVPVGYSGPPSGNFTPRGSWDFPAVIELTALRYDSTGNINPADPTSGAGITVQTVAISPGSGPPASFNFNRNPPGPPFAKQVDGSCAADVTSNFGYNCQITFDIVAASASNTYVFRIRPRYAGTHYQVEFHNNGGPAVSVADQNATVDVTAHAGDVYRRIEAKVPIKAGVASGLDFVLFSDTDICKDFSVVNGNAVPQTCPLP